MKTSLRILVLSLSVWMVASVPAVMAQHRGPSHHRHHYAPYRYGHHGYFHGRHHYPHGYFYPYGGHGYYHYGYYPHGYYPRYYYYSHGHHHHRHTYRPLFELRVH